MASAARLTGRLRTGRVAGEKDSPVLGGFLAEDVLAIVALAHLPLDGSRRLVVPLNGRPGRKDRRRPRRGVVHAVPPRTPQIMHFRHFSNHLTRCTTVVHARFSPIAGRTAVAVRRNFRKAINKCPAHVLAHVFHFLSVAQRIFGGRSGVCSVNEDERPGCRTTTGVHAAATLRAYVRFLPSFLS